MGLASFISRRAVPDTIIKCSFGVCQCHGNTQPEVAFAARIDGPFPGSPACTEPVEQVGIPGNSANFMSAKFCPAAGSAATCAMPEEAMTAKERKPTTAAKRFVVRMEAP